MNSDDLKTIKEWKINMICAPPPQMKANIIHVVRAKRCANNQKYGKPRKIKDTKVHTNITVQPYFELFCFKFMLLSRVLDFAASYH